MLRVCALAAVFAIAACGFAGADPVQAATAPAAIVRIYNQFGVSARDLAKAQASAAALFAASGIQIEWRVCTTARRQRGLGNDPCAAPLGAVEISARMLWGGPDDAQTGSLGYSLIDTASGVGSLATVFPDRIRTLAMRAAVPYTAVLGRALAHEIGHLLLGTTAHSSQGLMRPRWNPAILRARAAADWSFSDEEVASIARSLQTRSSGLPASSLAALIVP